MPVTKSAKRALRGSRVKEKVNKVISANLEVAIRLAKKTKSKEAVRKATSLADRAAKKGLIHKNKAARIKSSLSKLSTTKTQPKAKVAKKSKASKSTKKKKK